MELLIKAMLVSAVAAVLSLAVKKGSPETALLLGVAAACVSLCAAMRVLSGITALLRSLTELSGVSAPVISIILKVVGIGMLARLACGVCRDSGHSAAASAVEILGSAAALYAALPLMQSVLKMIASLI